MKLAALLIAILLTAAFTQTAIAQLIDTTDSRLTGLSLFAGRPIHGEYVSATSAMIGEEIDSITPSLALFEQEMQYLADNGFTFVTYDDIHFSNGKFEGHVQ